MVPGARFIRSLFQMFQRQITALSMLNVLDGNKGSMCSVG